MTIERKIFLEKPVLATIEQGPSVAREKYYELLSLERPPGTVLSMKMPQGEHDLLPYYLSEEENECTLQVLENGKGALLFDDQTSNIIHRIDPSGALLNTNREIVRFPEDKQVLPLIWKSEDGTNLELHEVIFYREGPNPPKEIVTFIY